MRYLQLLNNKKKSTPFRINWIVHSLHTKNTGSLQVNKFKIKTWAKPKLCIKLITVNTIIIYRY